MPPFYAYFVIYLGVILEGELALLTSALAAQRGLLNIWAVAFVAFAGTLTIDWGTFFLGRLMGRKIFERSPKFQSRTTKPLSLIRKNPVLILVIYRFLYGFRLVTLILLGMSYISVRKFLILSFLAILFWTGLFSFLGFYMGEVVSRYLVHFEGIALYLVIGLLVAVLIMVLIRMITRKLL